MVGLIGSALGVAGSIFGGMAASKAMKEANRGREAALEEQRKKNQDWFDRRYNEDATQRADAQRVLAMTEESSKRRNRAAAGTQAVMGGTEEGVAAAKEANNKALADAASRIAAAGEARKDTIEQQYMENDRALQSQLEELKYAKESGKAQNIAQAVGALGNAAGQMSLGNLEYGKKDEDGFRKSIPL